jgi:hypothetical protein
LEVVSIKENVLRGIGPSAINKRKTHCKRGHEFNKENTRITKKGRSCRICVLINERARRATARQSAHSELSASSQSGASSL